MPNSTPMTYDNDLDALGLLCPLPVLKIRKKLQTMAPGSILRVQADDPAAIIDIPHFCTETGHELITQTDEGLAQHYFIRKATLIVP